MVTEPFVIIFQWINSKLCLAMDPWNSAQDVVRCTLCQTPKDPMHCEVCHIHLCKDCVEKHLSDFSKVHKVVTFKQYLTTLKYPMCRKHPAKQCEFHCEQCDIPFCAKCVSSGKHLRHQTVDISINIENKKKLLQNDLQELEKNIYPRYLDLASDIPVQKADLSRNSQLLTTAINKQGEVWHREIDTIVKNLTSDVYKMECEHMTVLGHHEVNITQNISKITEAIEDLKEILESDDILLISEYKPKNAEFRRLPSKVKVSLPNFVPKNIIRNWLIQQFGSLSTLSFTTEEQEYKIPIQRGEFSPPDRSLIDVPRVITAIDTGYKCLNSVDCLNDDKIWTCGDGKILKLYNLQKEIVKSVETKFENQTRDIAVTRNENLVFTEYNDRTVNVLYENEQMQAVIKITGWIPRSLCCTSSNDLLVVMESDDYKQIKVVRYSGATENNAISLITKKGLSIHLGP
nr:E3 ubiquitin-protein ligase TRIM36-like [Crassostrea gigas]